MRPSRRMSQEDAVQLLREGTYGVLSIATSQGEPYGVPLNYYYLPEEQAIFFHCFVKGRKIDTIKENDRVSFVVIGRETIMPERFVTHYDSVMVEGRAEINRPGGENQTSAAALRHSGSRRFGAKG